MATALLRYLHARSISPEEVFLIAPFRPVARELYDLARGYPGMEIGTIRKMQGKESDVVILVLGGDTRKPGAKQWASERPNLLNVAASRARRRLYVVGNYELWKGYLYFSEMARPLPAKPAAELALKLRA